MKLTPQASMRTRAWPGPGAGVGNSRSAMTSGPPVWAIWMARMVLPCYNPRGTGEANGSDQTLRVWDLESGACLRTLEHTGLVGEGVTPDCRRAVSGSWDKTVLAASTR